MTIYDAAMKYAEEGTPLVVLAGKEYGSGSSRDWAAKGTNLLGVRAVIAESFERIHRSNLVGMGVLPLQFPDGESAESLGLTGEEEFSITGIDGGDAKEVTVRAGDKEFTARVRIDTPKEVEYFQHGGILPFVLRQLLATRSNLPGRCRSPRPAQAAHRARPLRLRAGAGGRLPRGRRRLRRGHLRHRRLDRRARAGTGDGPFVAVVGHIDEIGLIVHHIDDDGFLWFTGVGGWDPIILVGQRVEIATRDGAVPGVVGKKPIHLLKDDERKKAPELKDLHIDIGAKDGDEARSLVRIGDVAVIAGEPVELPNGRVVSRSMDNRLGCFVALEAARLVAEAGGAPGDVARGRGRAGGDHVRRRAHDRATRCGPTSRSSST